MNKYLLKGVEIGLGNIPDKENVFRVTKLLNLIVNDLEGFTIVTSELNTDNVKCYFVKNVVCSTFVEVRTVWMKSEAIKKARCWGNVDKNFAKLLRQSLKNK